MTDYISITETNKLIRKVLKESFPGVKFSVRGRSYSMGGSTDIYWTDGPNAKQVEGLISVFEGSYFDGMIDYKGSRYGTLDGQDVHFMVDFIFYERGWSDSLERRVAARIIKEYRLAELPGRPADVDSYVERYNNGDLYNMSPFSNEATLKGGSPYSLQAMLRNGCAKHTFKPFAKHSETLARVSFAGDAESDEEIEEWTLQDEYDACHSQGRSSVTGY